MAMDQLETFMAAIRKLESGSLEGNYTAIGVPTRTGHRARGAYQIMEQYWDGWAAEAGIAGADWRDPLAQDRVARYKFTQYYERYGDWRLVAIAWFAGPGRANTVAAQGIDKVANIADANGTTIGKYVQVITNNMQEAAAAGYGPKQAPLSMVADRATEQAQQRRRRVGPNDSMQFPSYPGANDSMEWPVYTPDMTGLSALSGTELLPGQMPGAMPAQTALGSIFRVLSNHRRKFGTSESLGEATV